MNSEDRQIATVKSVLALAARENPLHLTTAQIAGEMGLTQGALFRHFPSKDAIWAAVMNWIRDELLARIETAAVTAESPLEALRSMFFTHLAFITDHPGIPRLIFAELQSPDSSAYEVTRELLQRYSIVLELQVKMGQAAGQIRTDVAAEIVAQQFLGTIQGIVVQTLVSRRPQDMAEKGPASFALLRDAITRDTKESE